jgi:hypothetical protein
VGRKERRRKSPGGRRDSSSPAHRGMPPDSAVKDRALRYIFQENGGVKRKTGATYGSGVPTNERRIAALRWYVHRHR